MLKAHARLLGATIAALALSLPLAAAAQAPAAQPQQKAQAETGAKAASDKAMADRASPTTAPTKDAGNVPPKPDVVQAPAASSPPVPGKGSTAVPGWNNPPVWSTASERPAFTTIPGVDTNRLIQGAGREWRAFRNGPLTQVGGWILVGALAIVVLLYLVKGPIRLHGQPTGRLIERFSAVDRAAHWVMAISFIFLALTGIIILFGKHIILPWLGYTGFSWLTVVSKNIHNFVGPLFIFSLLVMFLVYVKDNLLNSQDFTWLSKLGGMMGKGPEIPSGRFNGGEKLWFWIGVVILGITLSVTGLILDFPNWNQGREAMQQANVIHGIAAILFTAFSFGHIYMSLTVVGAYRAMVDGYVDEAWAKQHHELWYEEIKAGKRPEKIVGGRMQPVAGDD